MESNTSQQILDYFNKSQNIVIVLPKQLDTDLVASAYALALFFSKLDKKALIVSSGQVPSGLDFLARDFTIQPEIPTGGDLVVSLNTKERELAELSYQTEPNKVNILLKAKSGSFGKDDIAVLAKQTSCDLLVILGSQSLEQLSAVYEASPEVFFQIPKINIDTEPNNEYYGTINLVDVTVSSLGELLTLLLIEAYGDLIDEPIATALLAGVIEKTHSFQSPQTTPQTLTAASQLVTKGAQQQNIIKSLYKTKEFTLLKLWGRALARIKTSSGNSLLYSVLKLNDFAKTETTVEQLPKVLQEFIDNVAGFQIIALIAEISENKFRLIIAAPPHVSVTDLADKLHGQLVSQTKLSRVYSAITLDFENLDLDELENRLTNALG